jgi:hypothetical protein
LGNIEPTDKVRPRNLGDKLSILQMEIPVKLNGQRQKVRVVFAKPEDLNFVAQWKAALGNDQNPYRVDTVDFAQLAVRRYEASRETGIYANTLSDISDHVQTNPKVEVAAFILFGPNPD